MSDSAAPFLRAFDTADTTFAAVPADGVDALVLYMDAAYANVAAAERRFPKLFAERRVLRLTALGATKGTDGIDWEKGDAEPSPRAWFQEAKAAGVWRPCFYADLCDLETIILPDLIGLLGKVPPPGPQRPYRIFAADPTGIEHMAVLHVGGNAIEADITQWWFTSISGRWPGASGDVDVSACLPSAFETVAPAAPAVHQWSAELQLSVPAGSTGTARFHGSVDLKTGKWAVAGLPGVVHWSGPGGGQWRSRGIELDAPPLGAK